MGEDVGHPLLRGQPGGVVRGAEQPDRRHRRRLGRGPQGVGPAVDGQAHALGLHHGAHVVDVLGEVGDRLVADSPGTVAQGVAGDRVGAGRAADAEVDPAGVRRLEQRELLGDDQRSVVGQHDAARAHPDPAGRPGQHRDQHRGVGGRHGRHVVVLGHPVAAVAELVGGAGQRHAGRDRVRRGLVAADRDEVEDGQGRAWGAHRRTTPGAPPPIPTGTVSGPPCGARSGPWPGSRPW